MSSGRARCIRARLCLVNSFWFPCSACFCATFLITQNADYTWRHNYANINKYTIINECMVYVHIYMVYNCVFSVYLRSAHKSKCNTLEIKVDVSTTEVTTKYAEVSNGCEREYTLDIPNMCVCMAVCLCIVSPWIGLFVLKVVLVLLCYIWMESIGDL